MEFSLKLFTTEVSKPVANTRLQGVHDDCLERELVYPPQFSCTETLHQNDNNISVVALGGYFPENLAMSKLTNELLIFNFSCTDDEIEQYETSVIYPLRHHVKTQKTPHMSGSYFPVLHNSACTCLNGVLYVFGGFLPDYNTNSNDMFIIKNLDNIDNVDCTMIPGPRSLAYASGADVWQNRFQTQSGDIPSERSGHALKSLNDGNNIILIGGTDLIKVMGRTQRTHGHPLFIMDISCFSWKKIVIVQGNTNLLSRASFTSSLSDENTFIIVGGKNENTEERYSVLNVVIIKIDPLNLTATIEAIDIDSPSMSFNPRLSHCAGSFKDNKLFLFGGFKSDREPTNELIEINVVTKTSIVCRPPTCIQEKTKIAAASAQWFGDHTMIIFGGTKPPLGFGGRSILLYTNKSMEPQKCSFGKISGMGLENSDLCAMTPEYAGDTRLIECDYCQKYAHIYCDKTLVSNKLPELYKCLVCKGSKTGFRKKLTKTKKKKK